LRYLPVAPTITTTTTPPLLPPTSPPPSFPLIVSSSHLLLLKTSLVDCFSKMTSFLALLQPVSSVHEPPSPFASQTSLRKRPKLSLNTQPGRTVGKSSTSLRLDTLSAVSPTARNTFKNACASSSARSTAGVALPRGQQESDEAPPASSLGTPSSASTTASHLTFSAEPIVPYALSYNIIPILTNSPIKTARRNMSAQTRPLLFPASKRVSFRNPLEEEIKTERYIMAHSDLLSMDSSIVSMVSISSDASATSSSTLTESDDDASGSSQPDISDDDGSLYRRDVQSSHGSWSASDSESDSCPAAPITARCKRRHDWAWPQGPSEEHEAPLENSDSTARSDG
jgi:hypothetical protein